MQNLQQRFSRAKPENQEDEAEYLDEEEQERLLQDLRRQNESSNLTIQRGMILVGILVSSIYSIFLYDLVFSSHATFYVPHIPVPFWGSPVASLMPAPELASMTSIACLYVSVYAFIHTCRLNAREAFLLQTPPEGRGLAPLGSHRIPIALSVILGSVAPIIALYDRASAIEVVFWLLPLLVLGLDVLALRMMRQVDEKIEALDKTRYSFKGA
ncbi:hypothetical protein BCR43DRAFT_481719 [Syncephalastrum racemosum]|uniref:Uncharacterized protein n=1 Tax=Syncephalastrum racemosum TaxID=13706 RepID=A0A1X2HSK8_SYNRA|nr:hypothetical protein BCR43DRAFT_481719 [Syncephalastrum racemosum]